MADEPGRGRLMSLSDMPWAEWLTTGGLGAALMKGADLVFGRKGREVSALGETIDRLSDQLAKSDLRQERFGERLEHVEGQHEKCEESLREVRGELAAAKAEIDRLMQGDVPAYERSDLKRQKTRDA